MAHTAENEASTDARATDILAPIPIARPFFDNAEEGAVAAVLRSGWVGQGPQVTCFEQVFAEYLGMKQAIAVSSGTSALHLALMAAGIGSGDVVIIPSFTFVATANAVEHTGASPLFVDINPATLNIAPAALEKYLSGLDATRRDRIKAIIPVSLFGLCAEMDRVNEIASHYRLTVIEDAACGLGATREGNRAGAESIMSCFSFHPRKLISTGEGGMIVTNDTSLADQMRSLRNHAATISDHQRHKNAGGSRLPEFNQLGYNYRMTDLQGAVGLEQMKKLPDFLKSRREAAAVYDHLLKSISPLRRPGAPDKYDHAYQSYVCLYRPDDALSDGLIDISKVDRLSEKRNHLMDRLEEKKIATRQGTHAIHTLGYYRDKYDLKNEHFPVSYMADRLSIALPLYYGITAEDQRRVVETMSKLI